MTKPAAIEAQLVDVRNLGTEKCVKLTLHVPSELAMQVVDAFGWPTNTNPVPVALARLNPDTGIRRPVREAGAKLKGQDGSASRSKKSWHDMAPAQQAGILCNEPSFQKFMLQEFGEYPGGCAEAVRGECHVKSRSEIQPGTRAAEIWAVIVSDYRAWMHEPEVVS